MIIIDNFFTKQLYYNQISYFTNYYDAYKFASNVKYDCQIWNCSKYLDECILMTTIIKNKYYDYIKG
jgi:hypothetical protein